MTDQEVAAVFADLEALYESGVERLFEVMFIVDVTLDNQAIQTVINRAIEQIQTFGGSVGRVEKWGRRKLAYDIDQQSDGYYVLLDVSVDPTRIAELDRALYLADEILRHKIIKVPAVFESRSLAHAPVSTQTDDHRTPGPRRTAAGTSSKDRRPPAKDPGFVDSSPSGHE